MFASLAGNQSVSLEGIMSRTFWVSCVLIFGLTSLAHAKKLRVLKGQQRDIARFQRAVSKSALHPEVKRKVLRTISKAQNAVISSKANYQRVYTRVTRYGGTLVFQPAWGRDITLHYHGSGNSRARNIEIFDNRKGARSAFRARVLSPQLTLMYRGRLSNDYAKETSAYRLYTDNRKRSTGLTTKLGQQLLWGGNDGYRSLVSQLEPMMAGSAPKGLTAGRNNTVKDLQKPVPVKVEQNLY
jgi:hypothetical protein